MNTLDASVEARMRLGIETWGTYEQDGVQIPVVDHVRALTLTTRQAHGMGRCAQDCLDSFNGCIESATNEVYRWACSNSYGWCLADCTPPRDQRVVAPVTEVASTAKTDVSATDSPPLRVADVDIPDDVLTGHASPAAACNESACQVFCRNSGWCTGLCVDTQCRCYDQRNPAGQCP